jgi:uncharacterized caspase-like protein
MKSRWIVALLVTLAVVAIPSISLAARWVALLIGNSSYRETARLPNPGNDVALLRRVLEDAGFDVVDEMQDLDRTAMVKALRAFETKANGSEIAWVYYSGHGMEMRGTNYLLPTDVRLASDVDVEDDSLVKEFKGHRGDITDVALSSDGKFALSGSADRTARLWDVASGNPLLTYIAGKEDFAAVAPDDSFVASDPSAFFAMEQRNALQSLEGFVREKKKDSLASELASER